MIIRYLTQNDITEHDKVTSQAFSIPCRIGSPDSVLPSEKVLGAFDDDNQTLFADFEILERKCRYDGGILTCAAIGGVAAKPEHRGKGAVNALFQHLFRACRYDVSILYPFSETYYRKLGYERAGQSVRACVPFSAFSAVRRNQDAKLYEGNDTAQLLEIYNRCAQNYNLSFVRENAKAFPDKPYEAQKFTYIWKRDAFATISVNREKSILFVHEIYFDSFASMCGILGFLRNYESNQKTICFQKIPADSPLLRFLPDLKDCDIRVFNTGAVRILNVKKVLQSHEYPSRDGGFTLQIGDEIYKVTVNEQGVAVDSNRAYRPDVSMGIHTASQILLGGFTDARYIPDLTIHQPNSDFFRMFPPRTTFFTDDF